jgi:DNA modification methylase
VLVNGTQEQDSLTSSTYHSLSGGHALSEASVKLEKLGLLNKVIQGDAIEVLKTLPDGCIDLVFADPPYNLQLTEGKKLIRWNRTVVDGVKEDWDRFTSFEDYDRFTLSWLKEVRRVMRPHATIWAIGTYHNIYRIGKTMQDHGFWVLNDVIWLKTNPVPNFLKVRFTNATETLIWAVRDRSDKKYYFDKVLAKKFGIGKVGANVWEIPLCIGKQRLKDSDGVKLHSTQKPEALLERVIQVSSKEGDIVLDPFGGTGTTAYIAKKLGRNFLTIEKNPRYIPYIEKRLLSL